MDLYVNRFVCGFVCGNIAAIYHFSCGIKFRQYTTFHRHYAIGPKWAPSGAEERYAIRRGRSSRSKEVLSAPRTAHRRSSTTRLERQRSRQSSFDIVTRRALGCVMFPQCIPSARELAGRPRLWYTVPRTCWVLGYPRTRSCSQPFEPFRLCRCLC